MSRSLFCLPCYAVDSYFEVVLCPVLLSSLPEFISCFLSLLAIGINVFVCTHIDSIVKKAQQRMYFLRQLKKFNLPQVHMTQFYSAVIESVLCSSITLWFGSACKSDIRRLQRTVRTAERTIGVHLPSLQDLYYSRVKKRAGNIITDPSHPGHNLFALLPSGRHYRSLCTRTSRHKNSFFPYAISSLNN